MNTFGKALKSTLFAVFSVWWVWLWLATALALFFVVKAPFASLVGLAMLIIALIAFLIALWANYKYEERES